MKSPAATILAALLLAGCAADGLVKNACAPAPRSIGEAGEKRFGVVGGGLIAGQLGTNLSDRERIRGIEAEYRALESTPAGEPVAWRDERTGHGGTVTATAPYRVGSQDCRSYTHVIEADGTSRTARGTACRNRDGSWTLLD